MSKRTQQLEVLPWDGGLVTAHDPSLLRPEDLVNADNITMRFSHDKTRRDGINYDWDNSTFEVTTRASDTFTRTLGGSFVNTGLVLGDTVTIDSANTKYGTNNEHYSITGVLTALSPTSIEILTTESYDESETVDTSLFWANRVIGAFDYWFEVGSAKAHFIMSVLDNGIVFANADGGNRTRLFSIGQPWSISPALSVANMETINNFLIIAVDGPNNQMVYWNGDLAKPLQDLPDSYYGIQNNVADGVVVRLSSITKASAGSVRTIQFNSSLSILAGSTIVIFGDDDKYTGTFTLASVVPGSLATVTYVDTRSIFNQAPTADTELHIGSFAPLAQNLRQHQGALWCDDKESLDELHYSGTDQFSWSVNGTSDGLAGATLVGFGDGDPAGITGIAPTFQGALFVGKRTKLYRINSVPGDFDNLSQVKVSDNIGFLSHQSIAAVGQTDLAFASERGLHSMATTNAYGDFFSNYLSKDINRTFAKEFTAVRKKYIKVCYVPEINSILMAVSDRQGGTNNAVYGYNLDNKRWYRWVGVESESMCSSLDNSVRTLYLGGYRGRLASTLGDLNFDIDYSGASMAISTTNTTGLLYMGAPSTLKLFKALRVFIAPQPNYTLTASVKVDNQVPQVLVFTAQSSAIPLGAMVLGVDVLGQSAISEPYALPIDGEGRCIQITFSQNDLSDPVALLGYTVDYMGGDKIQETIESGS